MELEIIVPALAVAYVPIGLVFAGLSLKVWLARDNLSPLAFLMFPNTFMEGKIGSDSNSIGTDICTPQRSGDEGRSARRKYTLLLMCVWPLKLVFNSISVLVYSVSRLGRLCRFVVHELADRSEAIRYAPSEGDDVSRLFIKSQALDRSLTRLQGQKRNLEHKLYEHERQKKAIVSALRDRTAEIQDAVGRVLADAPNS